MMKKKWSAIFIVLLLVFFIFVVVLFIAQDIHNNDLQVQVYRISQNFVDHRKEYQDVSDKILADEKITVIGQEFVNDFRQDKPLP